MVVEMKETIKKLIEEIGADLNNEHLSETPIRVERLFKNFFTYDKTMKVMSSKKRNTDCEKNIIPITIFDNKEKLNDIILSDGTFVSFCPHHIVNFFGDYVFGYLPQDYIIGKSKIDTVVKYFCGRLSTQETLVNDIADWFQKNLKPQGVFFMMKGKHLCEFLTTNKISNFTTSAVRGCFGKEEMKEEVYKMISFRCD